MANLIIDIGNTALKAAWSDEMTLGKVYRYQGEKVKDYILTLTEKQKPTILLISSVYSISPKDIEIYKKECESFIILDPSHTDYLVKNNLPEYLTFDRAASILACAYLFKNKDCTIFDFGNTLTIDYIDNKGQYQGGNISLGCRTRFRALNKYSKTLPLIDIPLDYDIIGQSLETSISSGVLEGIDLEIQGYINIKPNNIIIFTGGDANYFVKRMKNSIFVIFNLVLIGLALIANEYVKKTN